MKTGMKGAVLATTVGLMFMANIAMAQDNGSAGTGNSPSAQTIKVKCMGAKLQRLEFVQKRAA